MNLSCHCHECGGNIRKKLLVKNENDIDQKGLDNQLFGQRIKTEPVLGHQQLGIKRKTFYYPRVSNITRLGVSNPLNFQDIFDKKLSLKFAAPLTSRYKSPENKKQRTLSQRIQNTYFKNIDQKLKNSTKK
ncbi:unnamed protein product (macronuclear) [Paramecium tetraurelia]|uniref:Uncharacterized protein n=1 Tax=Paramecium tetraurelia TaxID=5888 RepID=A0BVA0_PARTE|nr:uncharacterized protein GSPATT00005713001 [Paramecium tetraurelia]CAK62467.1 unnamed protein product [Paramecium tetraurelia]|eukprot:XP_001429865.1 hypothetical protein (macronuclear) [Paramecium tetraurelia strain d4-2]